MPVTTLAVISEFLMNPTARILISLIENIGTEVILPTIPEACGIEIPQFLFTVSLKAIHGLQTTPL